MGRLAKLNLIMGAYTLVGIITFGHCASHYEVRSDRVDVAHADAATNALAAAMLWPLYWSWEVQVNG